MAGVQITKSNSVGLEQRYTLRKSINVYAGLTNVKSNSTCGIGMLDEFQTHRQPPADSQKLKMPAAATQLAFFRSFDSPVYHATAFI